MEFCTATGHKIDCLQSVRVTISFRNLMTFQVFENFYDKLNFALISTNGNATEMCSQIVRLLIYSFSGVV